MDTRPSATSCSHVSRAAQTTTDHDLPAPAAETNTSTSANTSNGSTSPTTSASRRPTARHALATADHYRI